MRTATTEIVCEGRVLIRRVGTHNFFTLQARKKGKAPPAKRAKKGSGSAQAKQSSAKGSRQKKSLSMLPTMPLDVLFEVKKSCISGCRPTLIVYRMHQVFSHLTPKDIINLSRTSRVFRDTLMMRNATSVWKAARERFGAPECPSNMNEPQWAVLLFGNLCQVRERSNFFTVPWYLPWV